MEIEEFYGNRTAKRSGVPLLNHIYEGLTILQELGAGWHAQRAYSIHPIYQSDEELKRNHAHLTYEDRHVIKLVMEYRNIANASLSSIVYRDYSADWNPLRLKHPIYISPLDEVNQMLIADKVQNYKDFLIYHKSTHERSAELEFYFLSWLTALGCDYNKLVGVLV